MSGQMVRVAVVDGILISGQVVVAAVVDGIIVSSQIVAAAEDCRRREHKIYTQSGQLPRYH